MKERRMVQCLHKLNDDALAEIQATKNPFGPLEIRARLAVGKTFRFQSGDAYTVQVSGAVVNANPKPWRNKAERKRYLRARRDVLANLQEAKV
jgi:hypothetical protein